MSETPPLTPIQAALSAKCECPCHGPDYDQESCKTCAGIVPVGCGGGLSVTDPTKWCAWELESVEDARDLDDQLDEEPPDDPADEPPYYWDPEG